MYNLEYIIYFATAVCSGIAFILARADKRIFLASINLGIFIFTFISIMAGAPAQPKTKSIECQYSNYLILADYDPTHKFEISNNTTIIKDSTDNVLMTINIPCVLAEN